MSPIIAQSKKNNKRKLDGPTDLLLKAQIYQNDPSDGEQQQPQHGDATSIVDTIPTVPSADINGKRETWVSDTTNEMHWLLLNKRQETLTPSFTPPTIVPPSPTVSSNATPTQTAIIKSKGEEPLSNLAVQFILGGLASIVILAVLARCIHVNRQQRTLIETRRHNLQEAQAQLSLHHSALRGTGTGTHITHITTDANGTRMMATTTRTTMVTPLGTHLVPTNSTTLAARLRMYQAQSQSWRDPYPYGQQPHGGVMDAGRESVSSFVAPSYEQDVSPPPFMNSSVTGKPPAYAEVFTATVPPVVVLPMLELPPRQQQQQESRRSSRSPSPAPPPDPVPAPAPERP
ncbi:hypothetical protein BGX24_010120 [Mortierella sp. AD032]|nr:hypothetical protein BGX24_010120 [Mortierella sp. AD032]